MSDSEDSDGEGGLGNVSRVIIRPPGTSGKAKRGHLCFDAAFETGNLGRADLIGEFEYDLFLRPDTCNPRYRFWFNFTVDNVKQDQRVIFNIVNISKTRNLFAHGLIPIVKSTSRPKWQRILREHVFYYRSTSHQNHYVLSFAFAFDKEDDVYQFTIAPPYSYSRLQSYLIVIESKYVEKRFDKTCLTKTLQNRNLDLITIDHVPKSQRIDNKNTLRVIVILSRSHPGEAPASYVCQGFLDFLIGDHPIANVLREKFIFKILPMVNPDGVFLGNNRCNLIGQDLNRTWHIATEFSHPTLYAIKNMLREIDNSDCYQIDFVIDIHAHTSLLGSFIYGNTYDDVYRYERHLVFPRLFATNAYDYVSKNIMFNADDRKLGTARRWCCEHLSDSLNAYTLEVSMYGYYLKDGKTVTPYTEDGYYRLGRNLARTFLQYYRFTNILPLPTVAELHPKRGRPKTHRPRGRSKIRQEIKPRPKTTRYYAPISYTDLSICYESGGGTSDEGSPIRQPPSHSSSFIHSKYRLKKQSAIPDHLSLLARSKSSKYDNLIDFPVSDYTRRTTTSKGNLPFRTVGTLNIPPRPYLSIIDFNQLTIGSLEEATANNKRSKQKSKT